MECWKMERIHLLESETNTYSNFHGNVVLLMDPSVHPLVAINISTPNLLGSSTK